MLFAVGCANDHPLDLLALAVADIEPDLHRAGAARRDFLAIHLRRGAPAGGLDAGDPDHLPARVPKRKRDGHDLFSGLRADIAKLRLPLDPGEGRSGQREKEYEKDPARPWPRRMDA